MSVGLLDAKAVWSRVGEDFLLIFVILLLGSAAQHALTAWKWMLILRRVDMPAAKSSGPLALFFITTLSGTAGQVMPPYLASLSVRGIGLRWYGNTTLLRTASVTAFEQFFDALVIAVVGLLSLFLLVVGQVGWIVIIWVGVFLGILNLVLWILPTNIFSGLVKRMEKGILKRLSSKLTAVVRTGVLTPRFAAIMLILSSIRFIVLAIRTALSGLIILPILSSSFIIMSFGTVQLTQFVAVTPGNIGITEWGWAGIALFTKAVTAADLAVFALVLRVTGAAAIIVLTCISGLVLWLRR